jgi:hypothetical protein
MVIMDMFVGRMHLAKPALRRSAFSSREEARLLFDSKLSQLVQVLRVPHNLYASPSLPALFSQIIETPNISS